MVEDTENQIMKVLQIRGEFWDNGPGTQSLTIAKQLKRRGYEVSFCASGGSLVDTIKQNGFNFHQIDELAFEKRSIMTVLGAIKRLSKLLRKEQFDIVHGHNAATVFIAYFASWFSGRSKPKFVQSCRGLEIRKGYGWRNWIYKVHPGKVFAVSNFTREFLLRIGMRERDVIVTYNGVDLERFDMAKMGYYREEVRKELDIPENALVVGIIGKMGFKGHDLLVESFSMLHGTYPNLYFVIVGSGDKFEEYRDLSKKFGVSDRAIFTGLRYDAERLNAAFDIFALPSKWGEMFPNAILESMSYGHPFVSSKLSGIPELAMNNEGLICNVNDVVDLTEKLETLISNEALRVKMGTHARKSIEEKYTIEKVVDRIEKGYLAQ